MFCQVPHDPYVHLVERSIARLRGVSEPVTEALDSFGESERDTHACLADAGCSEVACPAQRLEAGR